MLLGSKWYVATMQYTMMREGIVFTIKSIDGENVVCKVQKKLNLGKVGSDFEFMARRDHFGKYYKEVK